MKKIYFLIFYFLCILSNYQEFDNIILINSPIIINKSNTVYDGHNQTIILEKYANCPIIIIGDANSIEPLFQIENVTICNLNIIGTYEFQPDEIWNNEPNGIRCNGITIRHGKNIIIEYCNISSARSGGIVIEKESSNVIIRNCYIHDNYFDGIAGCYSNDCILINNICSNNQAAGMSFDLNFNNCKIENNILKNNNIGIFLRWSQNHQYTNNILQNKKYDFYINEVNNDIKTIPKNIILTNNQTDKNIIYSINQ